LSLGWVRRRGSVSRERGGAAQRRTRPPPARKRRSDGLPPADGRAPRPPCEAGLVVEQAMAPVGSTCAAAGPRRGAATLAVMPTTRRRPRGKEGGRLFRSRREGLEERPRLDPRSEDLVFFLSGELRWRRRRWVGFGRWSGGEASIK
jgi:hypothetical protein